MTLTAAPLVASVAIFSPYPIELSIAEDEESRLATTPVYQGEHASNVDFVSWSRNAEWWIEARSHSGALLHSGPLVRGQTVTIVGETLGAISGTVSPVWSAEGWTIACIADVNGAPFTFPTEPPLVPTIIASELQTAPRDYIANGSFSVSGLSPGGYTVVMLSPGFALEAHSSVQVIGGSTTSLSF
jgi:hypothetical protein